MKTLEPYDPGTIDLSETGPYRLETSQHVENNSKPVSTYFLNSTRFFFVLSKLLVAHQQYLTVASNKMIYSYWNYNDYRMNWIA